MARLTPVTAAVIAGVGAGTVAGVIAGGLGSGGSTPTAARSAPTAQALYDRSVGGAVEVDAGTQLAPTGTLTSSGSTGQYGSGFFVSPTELLTAGHVVYARSPRGQRQLAPLFVRTADGEHYPARVVAVEPHDDVALLRLTQTRPRVTVLGLATGPAPAPGAPVVSIGAPGDESTALSAGVISRAPLGVLDTAGTGYVLDVATDLASEDGSSGSPVIGADGRVVGMVEARDGNSGRPLTLARPADLLRRDLAELRSRTITSDPLSGSRLLALHADTAAEFGVGSPHGVLVRRLRAGAPLRAAGLHEGDEITAFDGRPVTTIADAIAALATHRPGDTVTVSFLRGAVPRQGSVRLAPRAAPGQG